MLIIGISRPRKFNVVSKIIRLHEGTQASHVYIKFYSQRYDLWLVYEASRGYVRFIEESNWKKINESLGEKQIDCGDQMDEIVKWCIQKSSTKYGYLTLLGILLKCDKMIEDGNKSFICTELAAKLLNLIGISLPEYSLKTFEEYI